MPKTENRNELKTKFYIKGAMALCTPNGRITEGKANRFDTICFILGNLVDLEGHSFNDDSKRRVIKKALLRLRGYKSRSLPYFSRALECEQTVAERKPWKRFHFVYPLSIPINSISHRKWLNTCGGRIYIHGREQASALYDLQEAFKARRRYTREYTEPPMIDWTFLSTSEMGQDYHPALSMADRRIELFRALLNFRRMYGRITLHFGMPSPLSSIPPAKHIYIFDEQRKYIVFAYNTPELPTSTGRLDADDVRLSIDLLKRIENIKNGSLKDILIEALLLYTVALDEIRPPYAFLHLWQILEILCLKDSSTTEKEVVKRVGGIFYNNPILTDALWALYEKRNLLVHEGRIEMISSSDVNQMKGFSEAMIRSFHGLVNEFKDRREFTYFYQNLNMHAREISMRRKILRKVQDLLVQG